ncbi:MAG: HAD family hydrolase, partial [Anaerolineae bacterium]
IIKPHPEPFRVVMNELGVAADETFYVGDRPHDDVLGAQAAGMRAVWVRRPFSQGLDDSIKPNAIIDSLDELPGVIDRWYPGWQATG